MARRWVSTSSTYFLIRPVLSSYGVTASRPTTHLLSKSFSSSPSTTSKKLTKLITRELAEEEEHGLGKMPEELEELQTKVAERWRIVQPPTDESSSHATVKLYRKDALSNGAKCVISFHCQDTMNPDDMMQEEEEGAKNEEDEELSATARFTISISKAGKIMKINCMTENAQVFVEGVMMTDEETEKASAAVQEELYNGPEFIELAEDVQDAFNEYVRKECRVDEDLVVYIAMMADYTEQTGYMNWLRGVRKILE